MSLSVLALFLGVLEAVHGAGLAQPHETVEIGGGDSINGWTPKPTQAPIARLAFGAVDKRDLFGGDLVARSINSYTCGWWDKNPASPIDCGSPTALCELFTDVPEPYFGCCDQTSGHVAKTDCVYRQFCLDYGDEDNGRTDSGFTVVSQTLFW